jgi:hypothetical protein
VVYEYLGHGIAYNRVYSDKNNALREPIYNNKVVYSFLGAARGEIYDEIDGNFRLDPL